MEERPRPVMGLGALQPRALPTYGADGLDLDLHRGGEGKRVGGSILALKKICSP